MECSRIKANLYLYAVLKNLEDLAEYDSETAELIRDWDVSIQFSVLVGPSAHIVFKGGKCSVGRGKLEKPSIVLFFVSPGHLVKMMEENFFPIPLKGFSRFGFLTKEFPKITEKLEAYMKPDDEKIKNPAFLELNTRMTLNTAVFAAREIALADSVGKQVLPQIRNGVVQVGIGDDGPAAYIDFQNGDIRAGKGRVDRPMALLSMKNVKVANDFLNGRIDAFTAIAAGDVAIRGITPMLDALGIIFDRIPHYLPAS